MVGLIRYLSGGLLHCTVFVFAFFAVVSGVSLIFRKYKKLCSDRRKAKRSSKGGRHA